MRSLLALLLLWSISVGFGCSSGGSDDSSSSSQTPAPAASAPAAPAPAAPAPAVSSFTPAPAAPVVALEPLGPLPDEAWIEIRNRSVEPIWFLFVSLINDPLGPEQIGDFDNIILPGESLTLTGISPCNLNYDVIVEFESGLVSATTLILPCGGTTPVDAF